MENKKHLLKTACNRNRILLIMTAIILNLPLYAIEISVSNFANLQAAIKEFNDSATENTTIVVDASFDITGALSITNANYALTITSDATIRTLMRTEELTGSIIVVGGDAKLILENIIIDGNSPVVVNSGALVRVGNRGTLTINNGAVIQNNNNDNTYGSGVTVSSGTLIMTGGAIRDNSCLYNIGAGIYASGSSVFTMTGGTVSGNAAQTGGGIYFGGTNSVFTMTGGTISDNEAKVGGGVYFGGTGSVFTMAGGTISGNEAKVGGGVAFGGASVTLAMTDGDRTLNLGGTAVIKDNTRGPGVDTPHSNLYLANERYITLGTGADGNGIALPAVSMETWVQTATASGVIVISDATAANVILFRSDESDKIVSHDNGQLVIR